MNLPTDEWLCKKMSKLNLTLVQGYPTRTSEAGGLLKDQFVRPPKSQGKWYGFHANPMSMYTCMRLTTSDGRFAMANFFSTFPIFYGHSSKFTCHPIFSLPDRKNRCRKSDVGCRKSESDTCKQLNINEKKGKDRCRKSAVGCRKPHTCVRRLRKALSKLSRLGTPDLPDSTARTSGSPDRPVLPVHLPCHDPFHKRICANGRGLRANRQ